MSFVVTRLGPALLLLVACSGSTTDPKPSGSAGMAALGGAAANGGAGGVAGERTSGEGGAPRFPLINGDPLCPKSAPNASPCEGGIHCAYNGIESGISYTDRFMSCNCVEGTWQCVSADREGFVTCPETKPAAGVATSCPSSDTLPCVYPLFEQHALASCWCGSGGGGGSSPYNWFCGL